MNEAPARHPAPAIVARGLAKTYHDSAAPIEVLRDVSLSGGPGGAQAGGAFGRRAAARRGGSRLAYEASGSSGGRADGKSGPAGLGDAAGNLRAVPVS